MILHLGERLPRLAEGVPHPGGFAGYCSFEAGGRRVGVRVLCLRAYLSSIAR
jgi:hypothetical protein